MKKNCNTNGQQKRRVDMIEFIVKYIKLLDDEKLSSIYQFVLHII